MTTFELLYGEPKDKSRVKKLYRLGEAREKKTLNLDQTRCIKDKDDNVLVQRAHINEVGMCTSINF